MPYIIYVDDNYHYMDESERYQHGTYKLLAEAEAEAREIVDAFLETAHKPGMTAAELFQGYTGYGQDPFIANTEGGAVEFSAWDYARERCAALCGH